MRWGRLLKGILVLWTAMAAFITALVLFAPFLTYLETLLPVTPGLKWLPVNVMLVLMVWFAVASFYGFHLIRTSKRESPWPDNAKRTVQRS